MNEWRCIFNEEAKINDLVAFPSAVVEGKIAGQYLLTLKKSPDTIIIQSVKDKGILAGREVVLDREHAESEGIKIASLPRRTRGGTKPVETINYNDLILKATDKCISEESSSEELAALLYTSGTTSKPKGVMLSHKNFLAECKIIKKLVRIKKDDCLIAVLPLFHIFGLASVLLGGLFWGCKVALVPQYSPKILIRSIKKFKVSIFCGIPVMFSHLLSSLRKKGEEEFPQSLRVCISGGAPLSSQIIEDFNTYFNINLQEGYGLTETTAAVCLNSSGITRPGSIGSPPQDVEMKIIGEEGKELPRGGIGEIVIKSETVTEGYYNSPQETLQTIKNGWLYSGDLGYQDKEGYFYIIERKKDLIIKDGLNVSALEVEEIIYWHPKVQDVAVIGISEKKGEAIKAFIVLKESQKCDSKEIIDFCKERMSFFKVPKYIEFKDFLPKSATGKILKKELKQGYKDLRLVRPTENSSLNASG
jgi:long-chain acyl-CoA synthetase